MLQATSLATIPRIRHAFFTRSGGVSQGVYASLNGGVGSSDAPHKVAENRARMAAALGVSADRLLTPYQIHSPDVVVADEPWTHDQRPRADAVITRLPQAWKNPAYRRARRLGHAPAQPLLESMSAHPAMARQAIPDHVPADWLPGEGPAGLVGDPAGAAAEFFRVLSLRR